MKRIICIFIALFLVLTLSSSLAASPSIGDVVTFGRYPQSASGNDLTPIEWIVLDKDGNNNALLLSKCVLDFVPFHKDDTYVLWEDCSLRTWLNTDFLEKAFDFNEQQSILTTKLDNSSQVSLYKGTAGNDTEDKVFLLSAVEAAKYLGVKHFREDGSKENKKSRAYATDYAVKKGAKVSDLQYTNDGHRSSNWILRTSESIVVYMVFFNGAFSNNNLTWLESNIRPAIWVHY